MGDGAVLTGQTDEKLLLGISGLQKADRIHSIMTGTTPPLIVTTGHAGHMIYIVLNLLWAVASGTT